MRRGERTPVPATPASLGASGGACVQLGIAAGGCWFRKCWPEMELGFFGSVSLQQKSRQRFFHRHQKEGREKALSNPAVAQYGKKNSVHQHCQHTRRLLGHGATKVN